VALGKEKPPAMAVSVAQVQERPIPVVAVVTGTVQAAERAAIAAKVSGTIVTMPILLGARVKAGDILATLSAEELTARMFQAETILAQAKRTLEREQNLLQKNAATPDAAKTAAEQHAIAQANFREAKTMMGYTTITAPFDGVVAQKRLNVGDLATPGAVLLHLENDHTLQVHASVPERLLHAFHDGKTLDVEIETADVTTQGTVTEIAPVVDPRTRTTVVKLSLPANAHLRSGQFSRIFVPDHTKNSLFVPASALIQSGQMETVFVAHQGLARLRLVRSGIRHEGMAEILTGLAAGETVVATNNRLLVDGQPLQVQP
jgi:RND family efflux transporter MFP subunit